LHRARRPGGLLLHPRFYGVFDVLDLVELDVQELPAWMSFFVM